MFSNGLEMARKEFLRLKRHVGVVAERLAKVKDKAPMCPYCGESSEPAFGERVYPQHKHLYSKHFFVCWGCNARVGCHPGTWKALGTPATANLRMLRKESHDLFDQLWTTVPGFVDAPMTRSEAYEWLAYMLDVPEAHIGQFTEEQCHELLDMKTDIKDRVDRTQENNNG